ncbi:MAG TPA: hypothetical protein VEL11_06195 [Candidatus Bathyarchaeia archaeon]|nr:hypothetical protein [Candidatus Bathyarchaeia archaeon]
MEWNRVDSCGQSSTFEISALRVRKLSLDIENLTPSPGSNNVLLVICSTSSLKAWAESYHLSGNYTMKRPHNRVEGRASRFTECLRSAFEGSMEPRTTTLPTVCDKLNVMSTRSKTRCDR